MFEAARRNAPGDSLDQRGVLVSRFILGLWVLFVLALSGCDNKPTTVQPNDNPVVPAEKGSMKKEPIPKPPSPENK